MDLPKNKIAYALPLLLALGAHSASAAVAVTYNDRIAFTTALGGAPVFTEDFEAPMSPGDDLSGVEFIPGVSVTSNAAVLEVFGGSGDQELFAIDAGLRAGPEDLYYDIEIDGYNAVGFDIDAFNPLTPGPGVLEVFFTDATSTLLNIFPTNATEADPIFFGVIADIAIDRIRWTEGPEIDGTGNEETGLDNFIVATTSVPEPASSALLLLGAAGLIWGRRR